MKRRGERGKEGRGGEGKEERERDRKSVGEWETPSQSPLPSAPRCSFCASPMENPGYAPDLTYSAVTYSALGLRVRKFLEISLGKFPEIYSNFSSNFLNIFSLNNFLIITIEKITKLACF